MSDVQRLVQQLFIEAASVCGDDPSAIQRYVAARLGDMSEEDRKRFEGVAEQVSAYKHDAKPPPEAQ